MVMFWVEMKNKQYESHHDQGLPMWVEFIVCWSGTSTYCRLLERGKRTLLVSHLTTGTPFRVYIDAFGRHPCTCALSSH